LLLLNQLWLVQVEAVRWSLFTNTVPYCNVLFTLSVVVAGNALAGRFNSGRYPPLYRAELLIIFVMTCVGSALGSGQFGQLLIASLVYPFHFASSGNHWNGTFVPLLPGWAMVSDPTATRNFYIGNSSIYRKENFGPWLAPIAFWTVFICVLLCTMACVNTILRRQWQVAERLSFPAIQLPLEMTAGPSFWRNRTVWAGIAVSAILTTYNGFAYLYPNLPMIPIKRFDVQKLLFTTPPWGGLGPDEGGIGTLNTSFYMFAIGLSFLMPTDISFSLWFFYLLNKLEHVAITAMGLYAPAGNPVGFDSMPPYDAAQSFGAVVAVFATTLFAARPYLVNVWRTAFDKDLKPLDDSAEPMRYRTAILGAFAGTAALAGLCHALGMTPLIAVAFLGIYFVIAIVVTRIRAEFGFPVHDFSQIGPLNPLLATFGPASMGSRNLTGFAMTWWFNRTYFAHPAPHQLEGMKCAEAAGAPQRAFLKAILLATAVGSIGIFWAYLYVVYRLGASSARMERWPISFPREIYTDLGHWFRNHSVPNYGAQRAAVFGLLFALTIGALRQRLAWFPLHPLGYAVCGSWGMTQIWMAVMVGSLCKMLFLRIGGLSLYRRSVPFFLGLILGEMVIGGGWTLVGIALGAPTYDFWP
jgi:hypothetical protein